MDNKPKFKIKKDGTKIVEPDTRLKEKVRGISASKIITEDNVAQANDFIDEEAKKFPEEIYGEIRDLNDAFVQFRNTEFTDEQTKDSAETFDTIKQLALSIKSSAGMFGYELATNIARSLFNFAENYQCTNSLGKKIMGVHVNALKVVLHKKISGDGGVVGKQLTKELQELVAQDKTRGESYTGSD